jgi:hypothetical protein
MKQTTNNRPEFIRPEQATLAGDMLRALIRIDERLDDLQVEASSFADMADRTLDGAVYGKTAMEHHAMFDAYGIARKLITREFRNNVIGKGGE